MAVGYLYREICIHVKHHETNLGPENMVTPVRRSLYYRQKVFNGQLLIKLLNITAVILLESEVRSQNASVVLTEQKIQKEIIMKEDMLRLESTLLVTVKNVMTSEPEVLQKPSALIVEADVKMSMLEQPRHGGTMKKVKSRSLWSGTKTFFSRFFKSDDD